MAKNWINEGTTLNNWVNGTGAKVASGEMVVVGDIVGVAKSDVEAGKTGPVSIVGVYELPKAAGSSFAQGKKAYWDGTAKKITDVGEDNIYAGIVYKPVLAAAATVLVKLAGGSGVVDVTNEIVDGVMVIAAGIHDTTGGDATESIALADVLETDVATAQLHTAGAAPETIVSCSAGAGKIDVTFSDDPADDHKISYLVIRPPA